MAGVAAILKNRVPTALGTAAAGLSGCLLWAYWPTILDMSFTWYASEKRLS